MALNKYQIIANGITYNCDQLSYEYSQLDGDTSGRSEDGTMFRDVIGMTTKIFCGFEYKQGTELQNLLSLISLTSTTLEYYDLKLGNRRTLKVYVVTDKVNIKLINGVEIADKIEIRFIQMDVD